MQRRLSREMVWAGSKRAVMQGEHIQYSSGVRIYKCATQKVMERNVASFCEARLKGEVLLSHYGQYERAIASHTLMTHHSALV